ncbi:hypothetical protein KKP91_02410 [Methanothermococcus sp. SCGC AD-155-M21]|nr:hypothetical protein [Methanothermococcus sp. SCGC AD-155-M21]
MEYIKEEMIKPILIGGVIGGVLSSIPIISCLNCCCLLYVLSGAITAHLITKEYIPSDRDYMISGALSGGVAGLVSWLLGTLFGVIIYGAMIPFMGDYYPNDLYMEMMGSSMIVNILYIPLYVLIGAVFGSIGGILYEKLKNK